MSDYRDHEDLEQNEVLTPEVVAFCKLLARIVMRQLKEQEVSTDQSHRSTASTLDMEVHNDTPAA